MTTFQRYGILAGPAAALVFLAAFATSSNPPGVADGGAATVAFYRAHSGGAHTSDVLWMVGLSLLVIFAGALRSRMREIASSEGLATLALAGAAVTAAGGSVYFGCDFALASMPSSMSPAAAQAINLLALQLVLPLGAGILVLGLTAGMAILSSQVAPAWTGWVAIVLALTGLAGPLSLVPLGLWAAVVGILAFRRASATDRESAPAAAHALS